MSGKRILVIVLAVIMSAGAFSSCTHPVTPSTPTDQVTVMGPRAVMPGLPARFTAHINFTPDAVVIYEWVFGDSTFTEYDSSITRTLKDTGLHIVHLSVLRTGSNETLCSAVDTFFVGDTTVYTPMDTTSHNFTWHEFTNVQNQNNMTGCWVYGPNDIYAVNDKIYHYNGTSWTVANFMYQGHYEGAFSGNSIFGLPGELWLTDGGIITRCNISNGTALEYRFGPSSGGPLHSSWGISSSDMYAVGDSGTILHFDGTNWTKMNSGTTKDIGEIWGTADNDIWADGFNPQTAESVLLHYDGKTWSEINLQSIGNIGPGNDGVGGVWATDSAGRKIVYITGSHVWHKKDAGPWSSDSGQVTNGVGGGQYIGIFYSGGNSANDFMVTGDGGFISHWNGRSWHRYDTLYAPGDLAFGTNGFSIQGNTACLVGVKDGNSWVLVGQRQ